MSLSSPLTSLEPVLAWITAHQQDAIADLQQFCRQPSISAQSQGMHEMAELVAKNLNALGATTTGVPTEGFPVIVGQLSGAISTRLAFYDHYDVQPPEPLAAWSVPPFDATIRDSKLYARGVADNKGNLVARLWAVRAWQAVHNTLPCNVTFLFEGEEEIGSPHLPSFAAAHQDLLKADGCVWESGNRDHRGAITLSAGLKGVLSVELRARTVAYDLHSSNAPLAPNAAWRLVEALNTLHNASGRVLIPGFYDAVQAPTPIEREMMQRFPINPQTLLQSWHSDHFINAASATDPIAATEHLLYSPTCNICGMWSGYTGTGGKTVLPATASAKLDFRLVPDQRPDTVQALLRQHLDQQGCADIEVVRLEQPSQPAQSSLDTPLVAAMARAATSTYHIEPNILPRKAGSGPMYELCLRYGIPVVNGAGAGNDDSHVHGPDENITLADFVLNMKLIATMLAEFAEQYK